MSDSVKKYYENVEEHEVVYSIETADDNLKRIEELIPTLTKGGKKTELLILVAKELLKQNK